MLKKPQNVYMPIDKFQAKIFKHKDAEKRGEWVSNFALALSEEAEDDFAKLLLDNAQLTWYKDTVKAWRSKAKKALSQGNNEPTAKQIHTWCCEEYGDEYLEAIELLMKNKEKLRKKTQAFINEINDILPPTGNDQTAGYASASDQEEETANDSGDALAEGGENGNASLDVHSGSDSAALESETPYADVSGSCKPDDEKGGCGPLEKPNSQKSQQPSLFPVAKPEKRRYGKYRHVLLTDDEGHKLRESLGEDLEDAVAILDEYIQSLPVKAKGSKKNGAKWWMQEYEAKDHYVILHHGWARKRLNEMRTEELNARAAELRCSAAETNAKAAEKRLENANSSSQPRQMYLTSDDISRRNAENGWRQIQLMHQMEGNG